MRFKAEYVFNCPLEKTIDICVTQVMGNVDYFKESFADVADVKLLKMEEKGGKRHVEYEFCAHGQIPKAAQKILKPDMLTWREVSYWDFDKNEYTFNIITHHFTKAFTCKGTWAYKEKGDGKSVQICKGKLKVNIPLLGGIMEKAIWANLKKGWDESDKTMKKKHGIL